MNWIPIEEDKPKDCEDVLFLCDDYVCVRQWILRWSTDTRVDWD